MNDYCIFNCPTCSCMIQIFKKDLNCHIFRHGIFKSNGKQINPHSDEKTVLGYISQDLIYGCGHPFKIENKDSKLAISVCEWI